MKKMNMLSLPLLIFSLTACATNQLDNGGSSAEQLKYNKVESLSKLRRFGRNTGFDILGELGSSNSEISHPLEIGMKGNITWGLSESSPGGRTAAVFNTDSVFLYSSVDDGQTYKKMVVDNKGTIDPRQYYDDYLNSISPRLFMVDYYKQTGLTKVKDLTYVGRDATEYATETISGGETVTITTYIDKDLGIVLYFASMQNNVESWFKVTSFKTGDQVVPPTFEN